MMLITALPDGAPPPQCDEGCAPLVVGVLLLALAVTAGLRERG